MSRIGMLIGIGLVVGLAACNSGSGNDGDDGDGDGGPLTGAATLGTDFLLALGQDANDDPLDGDDVDLTLTPQIEPFDP